MGSLFLYYFKPDTSGMHYYSSIETQMQWKLYLKFLSWLTIATGYKFSNLKYAHCCHFHGISLEIGLLIWRPWKNFILDVCINSFSTTLSYIMHENYFVVNFVLVRYTRGNTYVSCIKLNYRSILWNKFFFDIT